MPPTRSKVYHDTLKIRENMNRDKEKNFKTIKKPDLLMRHNDPKYVHT